MTFHLRYAIRSLLRAPGFAATATLTLALGIGATTAIFSVVNAVLLEPLPYRDPDRLVVTRLSLPDYRDLQRSSRSFEETAAWASNLYNLQNGDESRQVLGGVITRDLLPLLGVTPALGRNFTAEDERQRTVILSHGLWQSVFGGDPDAIGRVVDLGTGTFVVIGVAPAGFRFPTNEFQLWTPLGLLEVDAKPQAENRALRIFSAIGRLKPDVTFAQARGELETISATLAKTYPATNAEIVLPLESLTERIVGEVRTPLLVILVTVALLLLIACANVANLTLARSSGREREMAIRTALGAGRGRLFTQLAVESLVLAVIGGACGLLLALWAVDFVPAVLEARLPRAEAIRVDGTVLLVALAATLLTSLLFGTVPALQARGHAAALKDGGRSIAGGRHRRRLRSGIVAAEVGLAVLVVIGASLLVRSFLTLTSRDPGFVPDNLVTAMVQFVKLPDGPSRARASATLLDRLRDLPGVEAAGASTGLPPVTPQRASRVEIDGRQLTPDESSAHFLAATSDYFRAVRTPVLRGRAFERTDVAGAQPVVVINRTMADRLFPGSDPIGRRVRLLYPEFANDWRTIVGVVGDVRYRGFESDVPPAIYTPFEQTPFLWLYVMVRTTGDTDALTRSVRSVVQGVDPALSVANVRQMPDVVSGTVAEPRFSMLLVSGFAALALVLAVVGIYGVIAYSVSQRTQEIGVRMALGADRGAVLLMMIREGLTMAAIGIAAGLGAAGLATRLMRDLLVGVTPTDPIAFGAGAVLLLMLAVAASYLPARRATRVDPMVALRGD